ncbi:hypothetical protein A9Q84_14760 [Halobacteriovorax marinus]|uniref:AbiEi antitoxin C-terminal domain-containing protein n=1 Tax=Halobacteriovorax marinus TaxID=97084 RepID=A0A1Y5F517_9BACT|nr:hypothetical protein A9Q84_14760 [Halobacteriovorax marinus]
MSSTFLNTIQNSLKFSLFTDQDLRILFPKKESSAIHNSLSYHLKKNNLERYKRGLYSLVSRHKDETFSKFKLANKLSYESYVSFESALSHHGMIPEAVYEVTSACFRQKNRVFKNTMGVFSFRASPVRPFFLGVEKDEVTGALIANPVRAIFDLICARRKMYENVNELESDFRLDLVELKDVLKKYEASEILKLGKLYKKRTTENFANILVRDLM